MKPFKHTPGPWVFENNQQFDDEGRRRPSHPNQVMTKDGTGICEMYRDCPEHESNARLIAAAPEMLKFLQGFDPEDFHTAEAYDRLQRLLAKAEGILNSD